MVRSLVATAVSAAAGLSCLAAAASTTDPKVVAVGFGKDTSGSSTSSTSSSSSSRRRRAVKRGLSRRAGAQNAAITSDGSLYYLNITVGTPPQNLAVYVDSGSSDLWLPGSGSGADFCSTTQYGCGGLGEFSPAKSSSFNELKNMGDFEIQYGDGTQIAGAYFTDDVAIGNTKLSNVTMAVAIEGKTEYPVNGIMGVGYIDNEAPTEAEQQAGQLSPYPNIISQLKDQGVINTLAYSIYMNDLDSGKGTILFGGVDKAKYTGDLIVVPVQPDPAYEAAAAAQTGSSSGSNPFSSGGGGSKKKRQSSGSSTPNPVYDAFFVSLTGVSFSNSSTSNDYDLGYDSAAVLLDSGTSIIYLPDAAAMAIYKQFGAGVSDTYGPVIPCSAMNEGDISFTFGNGGPQVKVPMSQLVSQFGAAELNGSSAPTFHGGAQACQFGLSPSGDSDSSSSDSPPTFILGDTFMSSAYVVFDMTNNQIGLAQGNPNVTSSSIVEISSTIPGDSTISDSAATAVLTGSTVIHHSTKAPVGTGTAVAGDSSAAVTLQPGTPTPTHKSGAAGISAPSLHVSGIIGAVVAVVLGLSSGGALLTML